ncbi:hypothetical protein K8R78_07565 [bacterium]|nr:hypothetical protein [bacterium]
MKPQAIIFLLLLCLSTIGVASDGETLYLSGATAEQEQQLRQVWSEARLLPAGLSFDSPYPELLALATDDQQLLIIELLTGAAGLAVSGRLLAAGGFDLALGTIHTSYEPEHLIEAVWQLQGHVESEKILNTERAIPRELSALVEELEGLIGQGSAPQKGRLNQSALLREQRSHAYSQAEDDFFRQLNEAFYLETLLDETGYRKIQATVRFYLYCYRDEKLEDGSRQLKLRLSDDGIRALVRLIRG